MPVIGKQYYHLNAKFETASGVMPGQGQTVTIAGINVGKVQGVRLQNGQAVVEMELKEKYNRVYPDATMLLRPKTPLKDMIVELDPGTPAAGPKLKDGATLGVESTQPDVDFDQFLANLDVETRAQLAALLGDAGKALGGSGGRALARTLRRFDPLSRNAAKANKLLAQRTALIRRTITNFGQITNELGSRDAMLTRFVQANDQVFQRFANQNENLGETIRLLPDALASTSTALTKVGRLSSTLATGLPAVRPATKGLAPSLRQVRPFLEKTEPVLEKQLRPFGRAAQPTAKQLRPAARQFAQAVPDLNTFTGVLKNFFDALTYDPPGNDANSQSYLFYMAWAGHNTNSAISTQDGVGPLRRGMVLMSCGAQSLLESYAKPGFNPTMTTLLQLLNPPKAAERCPQGKDTK
ncbi:MAG: MlaD family protein, partial [Actinomycetota bacterium]|nr:MlaD family protein [Actinomycetota bacterium]